MRSLPYFTSVTSCFMMSLLPLNAHSIKPTQENVCTHMYSFIFHPNLNETQLYDATDSGFLAAYVSIRPV